MLSVADKKSVLILMVTLLFGTVLYSQSRRPVPSRDTISTSNANVTLPSGMFSQNRSGPKPYKEIITSKAISSKGLFKVHRLMKSGTSK